jgi:nucleotide-binding universal stress UspA family protein
MNSSSQPVARVVVGVDGSSQSKRALRWAAAVAASFDAEIDAVAAWQVPAMTGWTPAAVAWNPKQDMEQCLTEAVDDVFGANRPAKLRLTVHEGHAAQVLIRASKGASMVVVGSRGHGGFAGLLLGSVSASVAEHAHCPVLVIHGDEDPMSPPVELEQNHDQELAPEQAQQRQDRWVAAVETGTAPGADEGTLGQADDQDQMFSSVEVQRLRHSGVI